MCCIEWLPTPCMRCRWVMSFERPNLHFSVQRKQAALTANFGPLLAAAGEARGGTLW